jgi:hypothetical protein
LLSVGCSWSAVVERRTSLAVLEKDGYLENMKILQDPRNREILKKVGITPILPMDPESDFPADLKAEKDLQRECENYLNQRRRRCVWS